MTLSDPPAPPDRAPLGPGRAALIDAGLRLIARVGPGALSLRAIAAEAGLSHAAPAHYFGGLPGLTTAIATVAFARFSAALDAAQAAAGPGPRAQLLGLCEGYLDFAAEEAGLFHLMFTDPVVQRHDPHLQLAAGGAYGRLRAACAPFASPTGPEVLENAVWALVHGYALLTPPAGPGAPPSPGPGPRPPFAALLALLLPPAR